MNNFAPHQLDFYKTGHKDQYPKGTTMVYSNLTARSGKHSNVPNSKGIIFVGLQLFIKSYLHEEWDRTFFGQNKEKVLEKYSRRISKATNQEVSVEHLSKLHDLQYLPLEIKAFSEGTLVPYKIPMLTIKNTLPEFYWLTNYIESVMSAELWGIINSATTAREYLRVFLKYAEETCDNLLMVPYQGHDFSFRGMFGREAAAKSGFGHLCSFQGTDTVSALDIAQDYYGAHPVDLGGSVNATEHSCMASSINEILTQDNFIEYSEEFYDRTFDTSEYVYKIVDDKLIAEYAYFKRLITEIYPKGIVSIVSDTYDFWSVIGEVLPRLKDEILTRDGKVVIRPDSGDPVDIICGISSVRSDIHPSQPEAKGLIECLWNIFGGTINSKGYKVLDSHIGAIYGDSITLKRQEEILSRLKEKGFSSDNIVLGIGSYSYQGSSTRDTHGIAMKSTYCEVNGKGINIYKDPKTDDGTKKSAKGLLVVTKYSGTYILHDCCRPRAEEFNGLLETVFKNGVIVKETTFDEIRSLIYKDVFDEIRNEICDSDIL